MGQYYTPMIITDNNEPAMFVYTHDFGCGLKLMEHSYVKNEVVRRMETALFNNPQRVVWAGDYADNEENTETNLYQLADSSNTALKLMPFDNGEEPFNAKWLLNHDKKVAVAIPVYIKGVWQIHPLPLLTCEGNGRGGGDFRGTNPNVGAWARDRISVSETRPADFDIHDITFIEE